MKNQNKAVPKPPSKTLHEKLKSIYSQGQLGRNVQESKSAPLAMEEYVTPSISLVDENTGNTRPIKLQDIFEAFPDQTEVGRALVEGNVGAGKTTIVFNRIPSEWAKNRLFNDKFDYIFRINLKILDSGWQKDLYHTNDLDQYPLLCFIHYNLKLDNMGQEDPILLEALQDAMSNTEHSKILLVLDGYEVLAELKLQLKPVLRDVVSKLSEFKYIIATARKNSVPLLLRNRFERKIEVEGLTSVGITEYVSKHFNAQVNLVSKAVEDYANAYVKKDKASFQSALLQYFKGQSEPNQFAIYEQLRKVLGEHQHLSVEAITEKITTYYAASKKMMLKFLENPLIQQIAINPINLVILCLVCSNINEAENSLTITSLYEKFFIWLAKKCIERFNEDTKAEEIYTSEEFTVLKLLAFESVLNNNILNGQQIEDIALHHKLNMGSMYSFGLLKASNPAQKDAILANRDHVFDNPSVQDFLAALRFIELLTNNDQVAKEQAVNFIAGHRNEFKYLGMLKFIADFISTKAVYQKAREIFWEAVTCNVDKVTEIGAARKVTLLMHLLGNTIDKRIPNVDKIIDFIDETVLDNLFDWFDVIKSSGYISPKMQEQLLTFVKGDWESLSFYKIKSLIIVLGEMFSSFNKKEIIDIMIHKLSQSSDVRVKKILIQTYAKIINGSEIIKFLIGFIDNDVLGNEVQNIICDYIEKQSLGVTKEEAIGSVFQYLHSLTPEALAVSDNLLELIAKIIDKNPCYVKEFVDKGFPKIVNSFVAKLITLLDVDNDLITGSAAELITKIKTLENIDAKIVSEVVSKFMALANKIKEGNYFNNALYDAISAMLKIANREDDVENYLMFAFTYLVHKLPNTNNKHNIFKAISDITLIKNLDAKIVQKMTDLLLHFINSEEFGYGVKALVSVPISNIIEHYRSAINYDKSLLTLSMLKIFDHVDATELSSIQDSICRISAVDLDNQNLFYNGLIEREAKVFNPIIIETLSKIGFQEHNKIELILKQLLLEIRKPQKDDLIEKSIAHSLGNLAQILGKELQQEAIDSLKSILISTDHAIFPLALYSLGKLVKHNDVSEEDTSIILKILIKLLEINNYKIISSAFYVLNQLTSKIITTITQDLAEAIFKKIMDTSVNDVETPDSIMSVLNNIIIHVVDNDQTANQVIDKILLLNKNLQNEQVKLVLIEIIQGMMNTNIISLLEHSTYLVREAAIQVLLKKIESILVRVASSPSLELNAIPFRAEPIQGTISANALETESCEDKFLSDFEDMITILSKNNYDMEIENKLKLFSKARIIARKFIANINEKQLAWVVKDLGRLSDLGGEIKEIMKHLVQVSFKDEKITKLEAEFIAYCVKKFDFSLIISEFSFNSEAKVQFYILFEDKKTVFVGEENLINLEYIQRSILSGNNDALARQIISTEPLFTNSEAGMRKAAIDIADCPSIVDETQLDSRDWHCSIMFYSDEQKKFPKDLFMLLERRVAGHYVVDKIFIDNNHKVASVQRIVYPTDVDLIKQDLLGAMEYLNSKPRYYVLVFKLPLADGIKIIDALGEGARNTIFVGTTLGSQEHHSYSEVIIDNNSRSSHKIDSPSLKNLSQEAYDKLIEFFKPFLPVDIKNTLSKKWADLHPALTKFTKETLFKIMTRQESLSVDVPNLMQNIEEVQESLRDIQNLLKNVDFKVLEKIRLKEQETEAVREEVESILKDPYQKGLYHAVIRSLNGVFIACSAISTGMIKNNEVGSFGNIGNFLNIISSHTPLVGIGIYFVGQALVGIEQAQQQERVNNFVSAIQDSNEMCKFAEQIARWFVLELRKQNLKMKKEVHTSNSFGKIAGAAHDLIHTITQPNIADVVANVYSDIKQRVAYATSQNSEEKRSLADYLLRFVQGSGGDKSPAAKGEADAVIVAQAIVNAIFSGIIHDGNEKIIEITKHLVKEFGTENKPAIGSPKSVASSLEYPSNVPSKPQKSRPQSCIVCRAEVKKYDNAVLNEPYATRVLELLHPEARNSILGSKEEGAKFVEAVNKKGLDVVVNEYNLKQATPLVVEHTANYSAINTFFNQPEVKTLFFSIGAFNYNKIGDVIAHLGRSVKIIYTYTTPDGHKASYVEMFDKRLSNNNDTIIDDMTQYLKNLTFNSLEPIHVDESIAYINLIPISRDPITLISDEDGFRVASEEEIKEEELRNYVNTMPSESNNYRNSPLEEINLGSHIFQQIITF